MRVICGWEQKRLARALGMKQKALSALELGSRGIPVSRELLAAAARVMGRPESFIDETAAYVRRVLSAPLLQADGFERQIETIADRAGASFRRLFQESTLAAGHEALAATERAIAGSLWGYLASLPEEARPKAVEREALFHRWGFAERLWRESLNAASDDHRRALALGELSKAVVERADVSPEFRLRLEGLALSAIANARRVGGDLLAADLDFARAKVLWEAGAAGDPGLLDEASFHALEATLRRAQRRFPEALACLDRAFATAMQGVDVSYLLISKGNILLDLQRHEAAAAQFEEALARGRSTSSSRLTWLARFNLAACLCSLDRACEAEGALPALHQGAVEFGNGLDLLRIRWLEGQIQAASGRRDDAIATLALVRDGFLTRKILFDGALAGLERSVLLLEAGDLAAVKVEAPELAATFQQLKVAPELLASLGLFCAAAEAERATAEQARHMLARLRQEGSRPAPAS
jgi:transcriptional regulator with XRE-family HTH domain